MKKMILPLLLVGFTISARAYDFEVDGIYYDSLSANTCEVVRGDGTTEVTLVESVNIPEIVSYGGVDYEVVGIGADAFYGYTALKSVKIPATVSMIGNESFLHCKELVTFDVDAGNPVYSSYEGALYDKGRTRLIKLLVEKVEFYIPSSVIEICDDAFAWCRKLNKVYIPSGVIRIGDNAFAGCDSLTMVEIPISVEHIGASAFNHCKSLTSLELPNKVKGIGDYALAFCTELNSVSLPKGITVIPNGLFNGCTSLRTVNIPSNVVSIGEYSFAHCDSLQTLHIPNTVTKIGGNVFEGCRSLNQLEIPESVVSIGNQAFEYCVNIDTLALPSEVAEIGELAFNGCKSLTYIDVSEDNTSYKSFDGALYDYQLKRLIKVPSQEKVDSVPETVTHISPYAYFKCDSLSKVKIPEHVAKIGKWAFAGCGSLDSVYMVNPVNLSTTYLPGEKRTLFVPAGKKSDFESSSYYIAQYSLFKSIEEYGITPTAIIQLGGGRKR